MLILQNLIVLITEILKHVNNIIYELILIFIITYSHE